MKKNKTLMLSFALILFVMIAIAVLSTMNTSSDKKILNNSKVYDLESDYAESKPNLAKYQLLLYNDERIYFYNTENEKIVEDTSEIIKEIKYGYLSCDSFLKTNGINLKCEKTLDFFEILLFDKLELLTVDKEGNIINVEEEPYLDSQEGKYAFYGDYWYNNIKITQKDSNEEIYIRETYDSEGSSWFHALHRGEDGKIGKMIEIEDFYLDTEKYVEITEKEINFYKEGNLISQNKNYDKVYDIYDGKYVLVLDNQNLKLVDLSNNVIVDFGKCDISKSARVIEEDGKLFIEEIYSWGREKLLSFDMSGNFEYLEN